MWLGHVQPPTITIIINGVLGIYSRQTSDYSSVHHREEWDFRREHQQAHSACPDSRRGKMHHHQHDEFGSKHHL